MNLKIDFAIFTNVIMIQLLIQRYHKSTLGIRFFWEMKNYIRQILQTLHTIRDQTSTEEGFKNLFCG